jgi:hypothetical protein
VRLGVVRARLWLRTGWLAAADLGGLAVATPACGQPCIVQPGVSGGVLGVRSNARRGNGGAVRHRRRRVPRRLGGWSTRCAYVGFLGLLGSEGARTGWWALRAAIAGVGAAAARRQRWKPNSRGAQRREGDGVRGGVHACQATPAGAQGWGRDGVSWRRSRRSPARRHGWRRARRPWLVGAYATGVGGVCRRPKARRFFLLVTVRAPHNATAGSRRGGRPRHGGERRRRLEKGPKARPCLQGYGTRVLGCTLASAAARTSARARTRTRCGRDAGAPTRRGGDQTVVASYG